MTARLLLPGEQRVPLRVRQCLRAYALQIQPHGIATLQGRPRSQCRVPALELGPIFEALFLACRLDPRPDGYVGNAVLVAGYVFALAEPRVEHAVEPFNLAPITVERVGELLSRVVMKCASWPNIGPMLAAWNTSHLMTL